MYVRTLALPLLVLSLSGCDELLGSHGTPDWALVNKPKIQSAVNDQIRQLNPYPEELGNGYEDAKREYERTNQQIAELKRSGMQRCISLQPGSQEQRSQSANLPPPVPAYSGTFALAGKATPQVQACIQNLEKDQLILDLKAKASAFTDLQQQRRTHDLKVHKIMEATIDQAIASYAQANGFELIISNESSIAYNQNQQVLDVTNAIITQIRQPAPAQ